jgi:hypothetical protein
VWLFVVLAVAAAGVYFSFRAPAIVAVVIIWTMLIFGAWAYISDNPLPGPEPPRPRR